jgi:hypothetical protein
MLSRRTLLASHYALARAIPRRSRRRATTPREAFFLSEHRWAVEGLLAAAKAKDFSAWRWSGDEQERPLRSRLARTLMSLQTLDAPSPLELKLLAEIDYFWRELTRPGDLRSG